LVRVSRRVDSVQTCQQLESIDLNHLTFSITNITRFLALFETKTNN
jgi:hypothetical protein